MQAITLAAVVVFLLAIRLMWPLPSTKSQKPNCRPENDKIIDKQGRCRVWLFDDGTSAKGKLGDVLPKECCR